MQRLLTLRPSFLLGLDEKFEQSHFGREHAAGDGRYDVWLPDSGRFVESCLASALDRLVDTILDSLEVAYLYLFTLRCGCL